MKYLLMIMLLITNPLLAADLSNIMIQNCLVTTVAYSFGGAGCGGGSQKGSCCGFGPGQTVLRTLCTAYPATDCQMPVYVENYGNLLGTLHINVDDMLITAWIPVIPKKHFTMIVSDNYDNPNKWLRIWAD